KNCADRENNERNRHHTRTLMSVVNYAPTIPKKDVDHLPRHVERRKNDAGQHQVIRCMRSRPMRGGVKNFLLGPATGKDEGDAAQRHHTYGVRLKRNRHESPQTAHFTNVLLAMASVNHRARAEKQKRFEKTVREQMHDSSRHTADA